MTQTLKDKSILLVISGGIAAYKSLALIRLLRKDGAKIRCILTTGGAQFVTPLSVSALCEEEVYTDLWSLKNESEMGHIRLSREADLIVIAPASANLLAQMANGLAQDLASTTLLAADTPILIAPAMNHKMWDNPATQENIAKLHKRGLQQVGPTAGDMACGEHGMGRMSEPEEIFGAIQSFFFERKLKDLKALVTSGPTLEALDPVRYIGNRSSGKQGHAIAAALAAAGADVTLVSGPVALPPPSGVKTICVESADEMLNACEATLQANKKTDIAVCAAAVADYRPDTMQTHKIKKRDDQSAPHIALIENPDILKTIANFKKRPTMVIGFAAETQNLIESATAKLERKNCDVIIANNVGTDGKTFGADENHVYLLDASGAHDWGHHSKATIAQKLVEHIIHTIK